MTTETTIVDGRKVPFYRFEVGDKIIIARHGVIRDWATIVKRTPKMLVWQLGNEIHRIKIRTWTRIDWVAEMTVCGDIITFANSQPL